ncbi:MAG: A/G-specific adenine glycosylase [Robiginitomaculum sp.]|nr:A/G-specific adenine glycosylase [Robiginitomaculum sp.]
MKFEPNKLQASLLHWYDAGGRQLPWRVRPEQRASGVRPDPYRVWLSEIMCQQTRIQTVIPYFETFTKRWPNIDALANASREQIYQAWAGLGYYARARNLHACAGEIVANGQFPTTEANWLALPGIGPYTAAAVMAILHDAPTNVVDGNVERVIARLFAVPTPLPAAKPELRRLAGSLASPHRAGDYAQALMDLGALVCTPKSPNCPACPWANACQALAQHNPVGFPVRRPKPPRPERFGIAFVLQDSQRVLLRKRPETGLLGGMSEVPGSTWLPDPWSLADALTFAPCVGPWREAGQVRHVFTHFALNLRAMTLPAPAKFTPVEGWWAKRDELEQQALSSLMRKVLAVCL